MRLIIAMCFVLIIDNGSYAQSIQVLQSGKKVSLRGLSVVNDHTFWVSGSNGTVGLSIDGGKNIQWMQVPGYDTIDFRDIEAFSSTEAIIMGIASPAYILKTVDAGKTWKQVYKNDKPEMFLDAMEWWNSQSGIVIGDPINNKPFFARTFDGGATWQELPTEKLPLLEPGEACFASSGTNICALNKKEALFITGGKKSRCFIREKAIEIPIVQGGEITGAHGVTVASNGKNIIIVGGDYNKKNDTTKNCVLSSNGGKTFYNSTVPPSGYRSCVAYTYKKTAITCGLNGIDISTNHGITWKKISNEGFHVCKKAKKGTVMYLAGGNGRIGKLIAKKA